MSMTDWQPSETAPKDGTPILIFQPDKNGWLGDESFDDPRFAIGYWRPSGGWGNRNSATVRFTHWMPLPAPPLT